MKLNNCVDIAFIILHYMEKSATIKSIKAIEKKIDTPKYKIIIVDNASSNNTGKELQDDYSNNEKIVVLINQKNLGFAKGNNVGFGYAKKYFQPQYIVMLNNDVCLMENSLFSKLQKEFEMSRFAVLGPFIITKDGRCNINPVPNIKNKREIEERIKAIKRVLFVNKYSLLKWYTLLSDFKKDILKLKKKSYSNSSSYNYLEKQYNVQLHGCFWVFSREYIDKFDGLDDRTFLYMEEDILYKHMIENSMTTVYYPDIQVFHEEDVSTNVIVASEKEKIDFFYKNTLSSCKVLLEVYNEYENKRR